MSSRTITAWGMTTSTYRTVGVFTLTTASRSNTTTIRIKLWTRWLSRLLAIWVASLVQARPRQLVHISKAWVVTAIRRMRNLSEVIISNLELILSRASSDTCFTTAFGSTETASA